MADQQKKSRDRMVQKVKSTIDWARRAYFVFEILKHLLT